MKKKMIPIAAIHSNYSDNYFARPHDRGYNITCGEGCASNDDFLKNVVTYVWVAGIWYMYVYMY